MFTKRVLSVTAAIGLASSMITASPVIADSVADVIMNVGTAQAFTDEEVPDEDITTILNAGLSAASAINQQPWFFVALKDKELMEEIAGSGMSFPGAGGGAPEGKAPVGAPDGKAPEGAPEGKAPAGGEDQLPPQGAGGAKASFGDSPVAIIIYEDGNSMSPNPDFDCGLAAENMVICAASLGYGVKIVSSPTMALNGENHDTICEKLGVDPSMQAVAVLLIGNSDADAVSSASTREAFEAKASIVE